MIKIDKVNVMNMENAIRGMRNPMGSWGKSDSWWLDCKVGSCTWKEYRIGKNDLALATKLCKAGSDHRKFMRQIFVSMDILAPLYWWKEFDTYKVGTVANSTSTMHKIHAKEFVIDDFSHDHMRKIALGSLKCVVDDLEDLRKEFVETKNKEVWYDMIQLLPSSYNQLRTVTMTYENLINMYANRKNHKLDEWREFTKIVETLPYAKGLICYE